MARWQELMAKWEKEELVDVDDNPFNPDDEPDWEDELEADPFDPTGEDPVDLYGTWWE